MKVTLQALGTLLVQIAVSTGIVTVVGKIWVERRMASERARHEESIERLKNDLQLTKDKLLSAHHDKVAHYRQIVDLVAPMVAKIELLIHAKDTATAEVQQHLLAFEQERLRAYGYVGMFAPQPVMNRFDALIDYLFNVVDGKDKYDFTHVRTLAIALLNEIRKDLKIDDSTIEYRGTR